MTPRFLASKIRKMGVPFIELGNPKRRAVVSGFSFLALVRRKGKVREHKFGCGHNQFEMLVGH